MSEEIPVKQIGDLMEMVSEKVPALLKGLKDTMYSPEAGRSMGQAVGELYKSLIEAGIPTSDAIIMAKDYMLSFKDTAKSFTSSMNTNINEMDVDEDQAEDG